VTFGCSTRGKLKEDWARRQAERADQHSRASADSYPRAMRGASEQIV
jgi:hypothetical protein